MASVRVEPYQWKRAGKSFELSDEYFLTQKSRI